MNIGVVGQGFVGLTLSVFLAKKQFNVFGIENNHKKLISLKKGKPPFFEPNLEYTLQKCMKTKKLQFTESLKTIFHKLDIIYICVPTPNKKNSIDLKFLTRAINDIGILLKNSEKKPLILIKSTIAPTTANLLVEKLSKISHKKLGTDFFFAVNPEFLREGNAVSDQMHPHLIVIGCEDSSSESKIKTFFQKLYSSKTPKIFTNFSTAELIKYSNNAFLATKISFINSIANLCEKIPGANIDDVAKAIGTDPRIGSLFLKAGPGFGGSCLPKDLSSFISVYKNFGISPKLLDSVKNVNDIQINKIVETLKTKFKNLEGKTISILGLSFKENSDDVRDSRSILLIKQLLKQNCKIKVYDKLALENTKKLFGNKLIYNSTIKDCTKNSDCLIIMNSDDNFKKITKRDISGMKRKYVLDTRRIVKISDIEYKALGVNS